MKAIRAENPVHALWQGVDLLKIAGVKMGSRNGTTLEVPYPVTTIWPDPWKRCLILPARRANPFFHFFEALWILAGRRDVAFLEQFNPRMKEYSDDGIMFNAAYGYRLKNEFGVDQLERLIEQLRRDIHTRQAVGQIWSVDDLNRDTRDKACNLAIVFRYRGYGLDMTVLNRSNDMIWGTYGANLVQFSMIYEYVCAHVNVPMGTMYQVSNSYHVYTDGPGGKVWDRLVEWHDTRNSYYGLGTHYPIRKEVMWMKNNNLVDWQADLYEMFNLFDDKQYFYRYEFMTNYFRNLVCRMMNTWKCYKNGSWHSAVGYAEKIECAAWRAAAQAFLDERKPDDQKS